ncbi:hypothetical protein H072_7216 [Dactylellina haptotyla CBS 200.50]|uniref:MaoC-like domain-containing protein n=1 Tax=Dactylellina haptotyla (strain CBS 200.50) TaxID=1284197 RepID=S8A840_DACHA|nr:hypothetical protein H072_7216 [Dactylellina haptotyla CBS 200.50]
MVLPSLLRQTRRLVLNTPPRPALPSRSHPVLLRASLARVWRWTSTASAAAAKESPAAVEDPADLSLDPEISEHLKTLPVEARQLLVRDYPVIQEYLAPTQSHLLTLTLQPYLKFSDIAAPNPQEKRTLHNPFTIKNILPVYGQTLPPGFHLAYFNGYTQESDLSADGYISSQGPGGDWTRRMWAGGKLTFNSMPDKRRKGYDRGARRGRPLDIGRRAICHETIEDIQMKGEPGSDNEMMFVYIKRKLWGLGYIVKEPTKSPKLIGEVTTSEDDPTVILPDEEVPLVEQRCLVYMKPKPVEKDVPPMPKNNITTASKSRADKAEFSHNLTPTPTLLFRYSALTFNAHKIHLDPTYTKQNEGHKDLVVHGPLVLTFLLELLRNHTLGLEKEWKVNSFEYRNITPLFVNEPINIYGRLIPDAPVPERIPEEDPRERLPPMYDEMDALRKLLKQLTVQKTAGELTEEEYDAKRKPARKKLRALKSESDKLEKFHPVEQREIEYKVYELWAENDKGQIAVRGTALIEDLPQKAEMTPEQQWKRYQAELARNKRLLQKQALRSHKEMIREKKKERKSKLRYAQMERERVRRQQKEDEWKSRRDGAVAAGANALNENEDEENDESWEVIEGEEDFSDDEDLSDDGEDFSDDEDSKYDDDEDSKPKK